MSEVTCPKCGSKIHRVADHEYLLSKGWKRVPWPPDHKDRGGHLPYRNPEHPHDLFPIISAMIRQNFYDHRDTLPVVRCLWGGIVRDVYVIGGGVDRPLDGNPSGYDDWGCDLIPYKGELNGEPYDYVSNF